MGKYDFDLLILDEDPHERRNMTEAAEEAGLGRRMTISETAEEALVHLDRNPAVFLVSLDGAAGLEALERISRRAPPPRTAIIGLRSPTDGRLVPRAYELGMKSCLMRPTDRRGRIELFRNIRSYWEYFNVRS